MSEDFVTRINNERFEELYERVKYLDQGQYGVVQLYKDIEGNCLVALKILNKVDSVKNLMTEFRIMNTIKHKNVLSGQKFLYNTSQDIYIIVMQYCSKGNLTKYLKELYLKQETFKIRKCLEIAEGISAIHKNNIMHRDLKPDNILIDQTGTFKLGDFGFGREDNYSDKTERIGTPMYRDPNVNTGCYTKKCDVYSAGLIFDTIYRGKSVFENVTNQTWKNENLAFQKNKEERIKQLINCCDDMRQIILDCLAKDQRVRISSYALVERLQNLLEKLELKTIIGKESESLTIERINVNNEKNMPNSLILNGQFRKQKTTFLKNSKAHISSFPLQLMKAYQATQINEVKNRNSNAVLLFFKTRCQRIKSIQCLQQINVSKYLKKVIIFLVLFGYMRFLIIHELFLTKCQQSPINAVEGLSIVDLSQVTISTCVSLIQTQKKMIMQPLKHYCSDISIDKSTYQKFLSQKIKEMLREVNQKAMVQIHIKYETKQIQNEYQKLLQKMEFLNSKKQQEKKLELFCMREIF